VDLLVELEQPLGLAFVDLVYDLERKLGRKVELLTSDTLKLNQEHLRHQVIALNIQRTLTNVETPTR